MRDLLYAFMSFQVLFAFGHALKVLLLSFVSVYNEDEENQYIHHDIMLESFPLALEWMSFDPGPENKSGIFSYFDFIDNADLLSVVTKSITQ